MTLDNQKPRIQIEPKRTDSDGTGACMLMEEYGVQLDPWQQLICESILGKDEIGHYTTASSGISVSRQNGKSEIIIAICFYVLLIDGMKVLYTAHRQRSVKKIFFRLVSMFTNKLHPEIMQQVKQIKYGIGEESITLNNGGSIEFASRSRQVARGFDALSLVVFDEAQDLTDEQLAAIMSTLSASSSGERMMIFAGTPPYTGCSGEVFSRFRQSCILSAGRGENTVNSWFEWSPPAETMQELDITDQKLWEACNPAMHKRLTMEFTKQELQSLSAIDFARERLNFWEKAVTKESVLAIDPDLWESAKSDEERPEGKTAYGIKFTPDGSTVVLAGCVIPDKSSLQDVTEPPKGRITLIDVRNTGEGLNWLAEWLNERYKKASCVVIDGRNGADVLIDKIQRTWIVKGSIIKPTASQIVTAAGMLLNELREGGITWYSKQEELKISATTASKRQISGGFAFGGSDSAPIEACSLALYGCKTSRRNPQKKMRIDL